MVPVIQAITEAVASNLAVVHNVARHISLPLFYYHKVDWMDVLDPWMNSQNAAIRLHSLLVLAAVAGGLHSNQLLEFSQLDDTDRVTAILEMVCTAAQSPDLIVSECDYSFSAAELVRALAGLSSCSPVCRQAVVDEINLPILLVLLACGDLELQKAVCHLLWVLARHVSGESFLRDGESSVIETLEQFGDSQDADLQKLSKCAVFYLRSLDPRTG